MLRGDRSDSGFTVIEVVIAIAIAGLIMVLVFLGAAQLSSGRRDNERKADAARVLNATRQWVNNNNGTMPTSGDMGTIVSSYITLPGASFYVPSTTNTWTVSFMPKNGGAVDGIIYVYAPAVCNNSNGSLAAPAGSRQIAVVVYQENGGSYCVAQ